VDGLAALLAAPNVGSGNFAGDVFEQIDAGFVQLRDDLRRRVFFFFFASAHALVASLPGILFPQFANSILLTPDYATQCKTDSLCAVTLQLVQLLVLAFALGYGLCAVCPRQTAIKTAGAFGKTFAFYVLTMGYMRGVISGIGMLIGMSDLLLAIGFVWYLFQEGYAPGEVGEKPENLRK